MHADRLTYYDGNGVTTGIARRMSSPAGVSASPQRAPRRVTRVPFDATPSFRSLVYGLFQNRGTIETRARLFAYTAVFRSILCRSRFTAVVSAIPCQATRR